MEAGTRLELATPTWQGRALPTELFPRNKAAAVILDANGGESSWG